VKDTKFEIKGIHISGYYLCFKLKLNMLQGWSRTVRLFEFFFLVTLSIYAFWVAELERPVIRISNKWNESNWDF